MGLFSTQRAIIGLDIGGRYVKAVEFSDTGGSVPTVTGFAFQEVPSAESLPDIIKGLARSGKFHSHRTATSVSGRSVIIRYIPMPQTPEDQLRNAIKYEAGKYIPFEVEDTQLDCQKLGEEKAGGEMRVLLVAVKKNVIDDHVALIEAAGFVPGFVDVDSFALGNAFELRLRAKSLAAEDKVTALIDVGSQKTEINILRGTTTYFAREIYRAGNDLTEALSKKANLDAAGAEGLKRNPDAKSEEVREAVAGVVDDLCHEISLSFDYFESQFDREVQQIYLSGGGSLAPGTLETFERTFQKPTSRWDPLEGFPVNLPDAEVASMRANAAHLAVAAGLAARLLPE